MGMFDAVAPAIDTTEIQGGGRGFLTSDAIGGSVAGAVYSGLGSIYNTGVAAINGLGGNAEAFNTYDALDKLDHNWAGYYKENQNAIDVAGFIGSSLLPGTLGIKALNAVRAGEGMGAAGRALGFFQTRQARSLNAALEEMAVEGGSVFTQINKNKLAAMGWGYADQVLQAAAFETAVALTMKQSPILADDSWWDIGKSAMVGAAFGGVIGGSIDALILNKSFKTAVSSLDARSSTYNYGSNISNFALDTGDKAYGIVDSLLALPKAIIPEDKILDLSFHVGRPDKVTGWNPLTKKVELNVEKVLEQALSGANKTALNKFETTVRELASDPTAAVPFTQKILSDLQLMRNTDAEPSMIRERMGDWLFELRGVKPAVTEAKYGADELWYFKGKLTPEETAKLTTVEKLNAALVSNNPFSDNAYKKPYVFLGTAEQRKQAFENLAYIGRDGENGYPTLSAAWKAGRDVAINLDGTLRVNDASKLWRRADDPVYSNKQFLNSRTGAFSEDTVLTAADRAAPKTELLIQADGVTIPAAKGPGNFIKMTGTFDEAADATYYTARHAWASKLPDDRLPDSVRIDDFSLMDRLRTVPAERLESITILRPDGSALGKASELSVSDTIKAAKLSEAQRLLSEAFEAGKTLDVRELAYRLNVDAQWLETAVASRFRDAHEGQLGVGSKAVTNDAGVTLPLDAYTRRENLIVEYNRPQQFKELTGMGGRDIGWPEQRLIILDQVALTGGQFVTGELAWSYRVQEAIRVTKNASAAVLGGEKQAQLLDLAQDAAKLADSTGVGASSFGASNANYGEQLKLWAQDTGKKVHLWIQEATSSAMDQLGPVANKLRNDRKAAAEVGVVTNMLRATDEKYVWDILDTTEKRMVLKELHGLQGAKLQEAMAILKDEGRRAYINIESDVAAEFFKVHSAMNAERVGKRTVLNNARGFTSNISPDTIYVPPIDTTYFQHFAWVRPIEGKAFSTSEVTMVFGRDAAELRRRISLIDPQNFQVITKRGSEEWFKAKDLYDFSRTINEPRINSELRKSGALNNTFPEVRAENIAEDYIRWHQNQSGRLVRDAVETNYAQQVAEIRDLGKSYTEIATSKFAGTSRASSTEVVNPFDDYIKTALDVSKRSEYQLLHQANEFVDALGVRAYRFLRTAFDDGKKGLIPWSEVNAIAEKHGIKGVYSNDAEYFVSNVPRDRNLIKETITKANMFLANTVLRLDFFNSIVNTISTPLMIGTELASIRTALRNEPTLLGKLDEALTIAVPSDIGPTRGMRVPSTTKLQAQAISNYFGDRGKELIARYKANGDIKDINSQFHSMIDDLALRADFKVFGDGVTKAFETGAKITGNNLAEEMTRFISADVMRQLTDPAVAAGKLSLKEQNAFISVFTNRVQGNYISSQRPIVFQGVLGSAVSLFQTYSFNLMQQLLRHVSNKDKRAVGTMFGLQAGLFGLNGTPFFEAVNTHLIGNASINSEHRDAYSVAPELLGKELGDWLMYGTASAFPAWSGNWPALYTRGDINPRHMTILPINPLDMPFLDASRRVVSNVVDVGSKLAGGGAVVPTLLQGLEHNGLNRPLAGFAQVLSGQTTTSKGSLISAANEFDMVTTASRILGSRPMDEAVALNNLYRVQAYRAADRERMEKLGERVKSQLGRGNFPDDETMDRFMSDYAKSGGRLENFQAALTRWSKDANQSVVNKMRDKMSTSYGQRLSEIMGGEPLPDWSNAAMADAMSSSQQQSEVP